MNSKRIGKWVIVLFLLATLPGMTAVMAQGEEPAGKDATLAPEVVELGESVVTIPYTNHETEPNNTRQTASDIGYWYNDGIVRGGVIQQSGDYDYWKITTGYWWGGGRTRAVALFNIDARSFGSPLDAYITLYDDSGNVLARNDDMQGETNRDSLLYYNLEPDRVYYVSVTDYYGQGGADYRYQLLISEPVLVSAAAAKLGTGYVDGIPFQAGDVLAESQFKVSNTTYRKWVMLLDLSDLVPKGNLTNLAAGWRNSDYLLVGFAANLTLPGISGTVTPWEVVIFNPTQVGPDTAGTFERWWDGRQHGLTTTAEKIDAIDWPNWNGVTRLSVSTAGAAAVMGTSGTLKLADEDVGLWSASGDSWASQFDGTAKPSLNETVYNWGLGAKDVVAYSFMACASYDHFWWRSHQAVITSAGTIKLTWWSSWDETLHSTTRAINPKQITDFEYEWDFMDTPSPILRTSWDGAAHGWNYALDAIDFADYRGCD